MKKIILLAACLAILLCSSSCKTTADSGGDGDMVVEFTFQEAHHCTNLSPEIKVGKIPAGTVEFKIALTDLNVPSWNHGGGIVANDGSGLIPEGALTRGYNGPCPPRGSHVYQFTVTALDAQGNVLGKGKNKMRFP